MNHIYIKLSVPRGWVCQKNNNCTMQTRFFLKESEWRWWLSGWIKKSFTNTVKFYLKSVAQLSFHLVNNGSRQNKKAGGIQELVVSSNEGQGWNCKRHRCKATCHRQQLQTAIQSPWIKRNHTGITPAYTNIYQKSNIGLKKLSCVFAEGSVTLKL